MLDRLQHDDFVPYLNEAFYVHLGEGQTLAMELTDVAALGAAPGPEDAWRQAFSLVFRASDDGYLPQRIYRVTHDRLGALDLFLVPLGPGPQGGARYEAVFT